MKKVIHAIHQDGGMDKTTTTVCGRSGRRFSSTLNKYVTKDGMFRAVNGSDPLVGATCGKCRAVMNMWKARGRV